MPVPETSGETEAIVLIKASPQFGSKHGETVCCAGIDLDGNWLRMYPVSFRHLDDAQKFARWDRVKFRWSLPKIDRRVESRRIDQQSLRVVGKLPKPEHERFLASSIVTSLDRERKEGRSLALLRAEIKEFFFERKTDQEISKNEKEINRLLDQPDFFNTKHLIPYKPSPYRFKYTYETDDGPRTGTCQDWEIEATFFNWARQYGEKEALTLMCERFGNEYPAKGMVLAMGTHSLYPDVWLINGIIRLDRIRQMSLL